MQTTDQNIVPSPSGEGEGGVPSPQLLTPVWTGKAADLARAVALVKRTINPRICSLGLARLSITSAGFEIDTWDTTDSTQAHVAGESHGVSDFVHIEYNSLRRLVNNLQGAINLSLADNALTIEQDGARLRLNGVVVEESWNVPDPPDDIRWFDASTLPDPLRRVAIAMSKEEARAQITGVLMTEDSLVATDTHRLHVWPHGVETRPGIWQPVWPDYILPPTAIQWLTTIPSPSGEGKGGVLAPTPAIGFAAGHIFLRDSRGLLTARLVDGRFPNYQRVVPETFAWEMSLDSFAFQNALRFVAPIARENISSPRVILRVEDDRLHLSAENHSGEASTSTPLDQSFYTPKPPCPMAFNVNYLLDAIQSLTAPRPLIPQLIRISGNWSEDNRYQQIRVDRPAAGFIICMPMQMDMERKSDGK